MFCDRLEIAPATWIIAVTVIKSQADIAVIMETYKSFASSLSVMNSLQTLQAITEKINGNPRAKKDLQGWNTVFQFNIDGGAHYFLSISEDGSAHVEEGDHPSPETKLSSREDVMADILSGKLNAISAFMTGKLKVSGNIGKAQELVSVLDQLD
jgi:putative sterol carrier protein